MIRLIAATVRMPTPDCLSCLPAQKTVQACLSNSIRVGPNMTTLRTTCHVVTWTFAERSAPFLGRKIPFIARKEAEERPPEYLK